MNDQSSSTTNDPYTVAQQKLKRSLSAPKDDAPFGNLDASVRSRSFDLVTTLSTIESGKHKPAFAAEEADAAQRSTAGQVSLAAADVDQHGRDLATSLAGSSQPRASSNATYDESGLGRQLSNRSTSIGSSMIKRAAAVVDSAEQKQVPELVLAGEAVTAINAPAAADDVIIAAVEQAAPPAAAAAASESPSRTTEQAQQRDTSLDNEAMRQIPVPEDAANRNSSHSHTSEVSTADRTGSRRDSKQKSKPNKRSSTVTADPSPTALTSTDSAGSSSISSKALGLALPALAAISLAAAVVYLLKRRKQRSRPAAAAAAEDDEFTRALKEMDAEERAFNEQAAADNDPGAELSAEEAALAMQQADAARKEKMIAAALAEGDAELAKIDAIGSIDLEELDPDELAALEAELAELEGPPDGTQAPLGEVAS